MSPRSSALVQPFLLFLSDLRCVSQSGLVDPPSSDFSLRFGLPGSAPGPLPFVSALPNLSSSRLSTPAVSNQVLRNAFLRLPPRPCGSHHSSRCPRRQAGQGYRPTRPQYVLALLGSSVLPLIHLPLLSPTTEFADVLEQFESQFYAQALQKFQASDFTAAGFSDVQVPIQQFQAILSDEQAHSTTLQVRIE